MSSVTRPNRRAVTDSRLLLAAGLGTLAVCHVALAQNNPPPSQTDVLTKVSRNVVVVTSWDKGKAGAQLGSGILLQRDYVITQCHILKNTKRLGVTQGERHSEARMIHENRRRDLCELIVLNPVHFNPATIRIRWIDDVLVGETVYAVASPPGRNVELLKGRVADIRGAGEDKTIRISTKLNAGYSGAGLFDRFGALIGITLVRPDRDETAGSTVYPVQLFLEMTDTKTRQAQPPKILAADPAWEDQPAGAESTPPVKHAMNGRHGPAPKLPVDEAKPAAAPPPIKEAKAEPSTLTKSDVRPHATAADYKKAVKEYLEVIVRASTVQVAYPDEALRARWTGTSSILFRVKAGGDLSESYVDKSSGYATLDVTALLAVRKAIADIPPPPIVKERGMTATVAIAFVLPDN